MSDTSRRDLIGDACLALLAERGARGLTHRAVDERTELPPGSTSYYARSRAALLELALARAATLDAAMTPPNWPFDDSMSLADGIADTVHRMASTHHAETVARYELALEATRRTELREVYDAMGAEFQRMITEALASVGSTSPERHGRALLAWCEGVVFRTTAGPDHAAPPPRSELRATARELVAGLLTD